MTAPILVLDTASPIVSVAAGDRGDVLAERSLELRRTSELLLRAVEEVLDGAGLELAGLHGVAALQGPGSFTGLRIGLATVLGFHQALGLRATALPTLPILAAAAGAADADPNAAVVAAVDALRGDWYVRRFRRAAGSALPEPEAPARLMAGSALAELAPATLIGFGVEKLAEESWWNLSPAGLSRPGPALGLVEPPPLATVAVRALSASAIDWDPARLTAPIYFRPPAVTLPGKAGGTPPGAAR